MKCITTLASYPEDTNVSGVLASVYMRACVCVHACVRAYACLHRMCA